MTKKLLVALMVVLVFSTALVLNGCWLDSFPEDEQSDDQGDNDQDENDENTVYNGETFFWGSWTRMDTGEEWYFSDEKVVEAGTDYSIRSVDTSNISLYLNDGRDIAKESANVLKVIDDDNGSEYFLFRKSGSNANFKGSVKTTIAEARAFGMSGLGGIDVVISNLRNPENQVVVTTDSDGNFEAEGIILDDQYEVVPQLDDVSLAEIPEEEVAVQVQPRNDGEDTGNIIVTDQVYNFKVSHDQYWASFLYAGNDGYMDIREVTIRIKNVGTEDCTGAVYRLEPVEPELTISGNLQNIIGTIEPEAEKEITVDISCGPITEEFEDKHVKIIITDLEGNVWEDTVSFRFYRGQIRLHSTASFISNGSNINWVIITPENKTLHAQTEEEHWWTLPYRADGYQLVFSGASADSEAKYSFCVSDISWNGAASQTELEDFINPAAFEPNNGEAESVAVLLEEQVISYLHKNDIDFYTLSMSDHGTLEPPELQGAVYNEPIPAVSDTPIAVHVRIPSGVQTSGSFHYTLDGTDPTITSPIVQNTLFIGESATLKVRSFRQGWEPSAIVSRSFTINRPKTSPVPHDMIMEWRFDGDYQDTSGFDDHGYVHEDYLNRIELAEDRFGNADSAYRFYNWDYSQIANTQQNYSPTCFSYSIWFKTANQFYNGGRIAGFSSTQVGSSSTYDRHIYLTDEGKLIYGIYSDGYQEITPNGRMDDSQWHHVVAMYSSSFGMRLYVDGELAGMLSHYYDYNRSYEGYWKLGYNRCWDGVEYGFDGYIDDFRVYNRVLNEEEVLLLYNESNPIP